VSKTPDGTAMARQVMQTAAGHEIPLARSEIPVSKVTPLASGHIIRADTLRVELHQPPDTSTDNHQDGGESSPAGPSLAHDR
jgi:antitoxin (DNA-binding transcriptional repressor) of toxin-antitoxin stability system